MGRPGGTQTQVFGLSHVFYDRSRRHRCPAPNGAALLWQPGPGPGHRTHVRGRLWLPSPQGATCWIMPAPHGLGQSGLRKPVNPGMGSTARPAAHHSGAPSGAGQAAEVHENSPPRATLASSRTNTRIWLWGDPKACL